MLLISPAGVILRMPEEPPSVLIVDDEADVIEVYKLALPDEYRVTSETSGEAALQELDDSIDVVLLDRRMPNMPGAEVLDEIRSRGVDVRVAMVTAVPPDFDVLEMDFDAYLTKPIEDSDVRETVQELLQLAEYDEHMRQRFSIAVRIATLKANKPASELESNETYQRLQKRAEDLEEVQVEQISDMDPGTFTKSLSWPTESDESGDG
jgi:CheY-like chemotaxis protein